MFGIEILQYGFILRGLEAGIIVAIIAPLIGIFLVLRRYALIADTLSHVSLAGIAMGLLLGVHPIIAAVLSSLGASTAIEYLRTNNKTYGESALAIFLSGSLAFAVVLIGLAHGFTVNLFSYLFGSIVTVKDSDLYIVASLGILVAVCIGLFFKELIFVTFDEEAAKVGGIPVTFINQLLILLSALTIALAIPIIGVLLVSALIVIPVSSALQLRRNFRETLIIAEIFSVFSVVAGIFASYYLNLATGGTIVLITLGIFIITSYATKD